MENIIYYYVVFIIVILVKLQKYLKEDIKDVEIPNNKYKWLVIIDGMDIAFSAAGVIIYLFVKSEPKWYQTIFSLAIFLYLVAFIADSLSNKYIALKRSLNITVVSVIFFVTYLVFSPEVNFFGVSLNKIQKHDEKPNTGKRKFRVVIPYQDLTLISHLGITKSSNIYFLYEKQIEDSTKNGAIEKITDLFLRDTLIRPILPYKRDSKNYLDKNSFIKYDLDKIYIIDN